MNAQEHKEILEMALLDYNRQRGEIADKMRQLTAALGFGNGAIPEVTPEPLFDKKVFAVKPRKRKKRSAEVRARMAEAQRLRWRRIKKGQVRFA